MVKRVGDKIFIAVAPKRGNGDIEEVAKGGINLIINNRPDGESDDQMSSAEIEATARALAWTMSIFQWFRPKSPMNKSPRWPRRSNRLAMAISSRHAGRACVR